MNDGFEAIKRRIDRAVANERPIEQGRSLEGSQFSVADQMRANAFDLAEYLLEKEVQPVTDKILGVLTANEMTRVMVENTRPRIVQIGNISVSPASKYDSSGATVPLYGRPDTRERISTGGVSKTGVAIMLTGELCSFRDSDQSDTTKIVHPVRQASLGDSYLEGSNRYSLTMPNLYVREHPRLVMWRDLLAEFGSHALLGEPFTPIKSF